MSGSELLLLEDLQLFISKLDVSHLLTLVGDSDNLGDLSLLLELGSSLFSAFLAGEDNDSDEEKDEDWSLESSFSEFLLETSHVILGSGMFILTLVVALGFWAFFSLLIRGALRGGRVVFMWLSITESFSFFMFNSNSWLRGLEEWFLSLNRLVDLILILVLLLSLSPSVSVFNDLSGLSIEFLLTISFLSRPLSTVFSSLSSTMSVLSVSSSLFFRG